MYLGPNRQENTVFWTYPRYTPLPRLNVYQTPQNFGSIYVLNVYSFSATGNPLVCSCNLLWLAENTQKKGSMKVLATCKDHTTLKRKEVTSLAEDEYCS